MQIVMTMAIAACLGATTLEQGFPWEIFKPRTLEEVISITTKALRPDDSMFLATNQLESKVEVIYTGKSRPILIARKGFISVWVRTFNRPGEYGELYQREYLYKDGGEEYWLATSRPITKFFDKELKPGDKIDLYLISIGAYRSKEGVDCMLLVEEFQKRQTQQAVTADPIESRLFSSGW